MDKKKPKRYQQKRKLWYRNLKRVMKVRYKEPTFIYLGEKPTERSIILSNHVGTDAPLSLEIYADFPLRMWGTAEMNSGIVRLYKYQTKVYYHEKKHWNLHLARLFCLLASPLTNMFYKGLRLISTYRDVRLKGTLEESLRIIKEDRDNIVIFPEKSEAGYSDELTGFHAGFVMFGELCYKNGIDLPIFVSYFNKKELNYIFSKPMRYSTLKAQFKDRQEIADYLAQECNNLGKLRPGEFDDEPA